MQYVVPAIIDAYTEEGTEGPMRGGLKMGRHGVESYMQMSYRAYAQVLDMTNHLMNGTHPLQSAATPSIRMEFNPDIGVRPVGFRPFEYNAQIRPEGQAAIEDELDKGLVSAGTEEEGGATNVVIALGVGAVVLGGFAWFVFRR